MARRLRLRRGVRPPWAYSLHTVGSAHSGAAGYARRSAPAVGACVDNGTHPSDSTYLDGASCTAPHWKMRPDLPMCAVVYV